MRNKLPTLIVLALAASSLLFDWPKLVNEAHAREQRLDQTSTNTESPPQATASRSKR